MHMNGERCTFPTAIYEPAGDGKVDEIGGRLRHGSHGMAFEGNRKAVIRSPVRTGAGKCPGHPRPCPSTKRHARF